MNHAGVAASAWSRTAGSTFYPVALRSYLWNSFRDAETFPRIYFLSAVTWRGSNMTPAAAPCRASPDMPSRLPAGAGSAEGISSNEQHPVSDDAWMGPRLDIECLPEAICDPFAPCPVPTLAEGLQNDTGTTPRRKTPRG